MKFLFIDTRRGIPRNVAMNKFIFPLLIAAAAILGFSGCATSSKTAKNRCYELRTYHAMPGKLDDLNARFREHTMTLFKKHGMENVGYWTPIENTNNVLIYLLAYPNREARAASWKAFGADPEWRSVAKQSEENGKLVAKVDSVFLEQTDFSPLLKKGNISHGGIFELRTYTTPVGALPNLDARFREHTMALFKKHGMKNWVYFHKMGDQPDANTTLIYFLAHSSVDAAKASFDAFRQDPKWIAAKAASERSGPLTVKDGVQSLFLIPTDYSPTK